jgi:putative transposase
LTPYIKRIKSHDDWRTRDLSKEGYIYIWSDGIYFNIRSDDAKLSIFVIIGVTSCDNKEFIAIKDGYRKTDERQKLRIIMFPFSAFDYNSPQ